MTTYRFEKVSHTAHQRVRCAVCGKKFNRQRTFTNTINPFNKNPDGSVRTYDEVNARVMVMASQWLPLPDCGKHEASS